MLNYFFHWYTGAVWSNIIASLIWAAPTSLIAYWRIRTHQKRHHDTQMAALRAIHRAVKRGDFEG